MFWITSALGMACVAAAFVAVKVFSARPVSWAGSEILGMCSSAALFVFCTVMGLWCYATAIIRSEWSRMGASKLPESAGRSRLASACRNRTR